ncbi:MAG: hypothetical protein WAN65_13375 [Candidatus Sulfotelmatobacter sp.]
MTTVVKIPPRPGYPARKTLPPSIKVRRDVEWFWRNDRTLCIGALAIDPGPTEECIVLCADRKVSTPDWEFASETEYKFHALSPQFVALASDSLSQAKELADIYRFHLKSVPLTAENVLEEMRKPPIVLKRRLANSYIGRCLGLSYDEWVKHGRDWFGDTIFERHEDTIAKHALRVQLLIAGFVDRKAFLFELVSDEVSVVTNFSMIGAGSYTASPALHARSQTRATMLDQALYNVYEAKKMGEGSPSVGKKTMMRVLHPPATIGGPVCEQIVTASGAAALEELFGEYGPKPMASCTLPEDSLQWVPLPMESGR